MTARMIPARQWGSAYTDEVVLTDAQQYACATCSQVAQTIVMVNGTIFCKEHNPNAIQQA